MKRLLLWGGTLLLFAGAGVWLVSWWNEPVQNNHFSVKTSETNVLGNETTLVTWQTNFFVTQIPSTFRILNSSEIKQGNVEGQYLLSSRSLNNTDQGGVTIGTLNGYSLHELPAVRLREEQPDMYVSSTVSFAPEGSIVFSSKKDYETAVFWQSGDTYAAVVFSGISTHKADLDQALEAVITHWKFL